MDGSLAFTSRTGLLRTRYPMQQVNCDASNVATRKSLNRTS
ncbi:hypothetical protein BCh11DRAFT_01861 [Burkholderia sp. Ch1-1]|nr:hypothetical protein BCh11DRAFT_01861 [Burkholderia sp. Ch1-1]